MCNWQTDWLKILKLRLPQQADKYESFHKTSLEMLDTRNIKNIFISFKLNEMQNSDIR